MMSVFRRTASVSMVALGIGLASAANAQVAGSPTPRDASPTTPESSSSAGKPASDSNVIVVTARRRDETLISVPVAVSVVTGGELARRSITQLDNLAQVVPQLLIAHGGGNPQGAVIVIRGIGVGEANPFADQAVSFNIDSAQVARGNLRRMAEVDVAQIEVLKGPQALFFGKNSPAGIIVIHTADPQSYFDAGVRSSYEFIADESRTEAYVSGPVAADFGARAVVYGSRMQGYFKNAALPHPLFGPAFKRVPNAKDYGGRLTLKFAPAGSDFDAKLKLNYAHLRTSGPASDFQVIDCPLGLSQLAPVGEDCKANNTVVVNRVGPNFAAVLDASLTDRTYLTQNQFLGGLEMNYRLGDQLKLTSVTSQYHVKTRFSSIFTPVDPTFANRIGTAAQYFKANEISQELRLASDFGGAFDFLTGGIYQHSKLNFSNLSPANGLAPFLLVAFTPVTQVGEAYSAFAQGTLRLSQFELAVGGRYSHEHKRIAFVNAAGAPLATAVPERSWHNFSPEATLTWRPSTELTVYGGFKRGFLSGGFNGTAGQNVSNSRAYDQQTTEGLEGGVKSLLFDRKLSLTLAAYTYVTKGLQVNANVVTPSGLLTQVVLNAGRARTKGFEFESNYTVGNGLSLRGSLAYNDGRYTKFTAPCYSGQTIAQGCNALPNAAGTAFTGQDLKGRPLVRAPKWNLKGGFVYEHDLGVGDSVTLSSDANYSSGFFTNVTDKPGGRQSGFAMVDASLIYADHRGFDVGVVGRNLTNKYVYYRTIDGTFTGSGTGTNSGRPSDTIGNVSRGREILLRVGVKFGGR